MIRDSCRDRLGSRLLTMAEEEGRRRGCTRVTLFTMEIQAPGFYLKQGYGLEATLHDYYAEGDDMVIFRKKFSGGGRRDAGPATNRLP